MAQGVRGIREVGRAVHAARVASGMTQKEFAATVGVSGNTLGKIERGEDVQGGKLRTVAEALGLDVAPPAGEGHSIESARVMVELWMKALPEERRGAALDHIARAMADFPQV